MKRFFLLFLVSFFVVSCEEHRGEWVPPMIYDVVFTPTRIKRGEKLTISYSVEEKGDYNRYLSELFVNEEGKLVHPDRTGDYNDIVNFNIQFSADARPWIQREKDKVAILYDAKDYQLNETVPEKYVSYRWGKIECIIPDDAVSGVIKLADYIGLQDTGFSDEPLIIVDESGNEIAK